MRVVYCAFAFIPLCQATFWDRVSFWQTEWATDAEEGNAVNGLMARDGDEYVYSDTQQILELPTKQDSWDVKNYAKTKHEPQSNQNNQDRKNKQSHRRNDQTTDNTRDWQRKQDRQKTHHSQGDENDWKKMVNTYLTTGFMYSTLSHGFLFLLGCMCMNIQQKKVPVRNVPHVSAEDLSSKALQSELELLELRLKSFCQQLLLNTLNKNDCHRSFSSSSYVLPPGTLGTNIAK